MSLSRVPCEDPEPHGHCVSPIAYRDDGEGPVRVVAEGGDEAVVHPELVAENRKVGTRLRELAPAVSQPGGGIRGGSIPQKQES